MRASFSLTGSGKSFFFYDPALTRLFPYVILTMLRSAVTRQATTVKGAYTWRDGSCGTQAWQTINGEGCLMIRCGLARGMRPRFWAKWLSWQTQGGRVKTPASFRSFQAETSPQRAPSRVGSIPVAMRKKREFDKRVQQAAVALAAKT